jgi:hypothetical protein
MTTQRTPGDGPSVPSALTDPDVDSERRLEILWARVQRLEAELEGLQDGRPPPGGPTRRAHRRVEQANQAPPDGS